MDLMKGLQLIVAVIISAVITSSQTRSIQQRSCEAPQPPTCVNGCNDISYYHSKPTDACVECISCPPGQEPNLYDPCVAQTEGKEVRCQPCPDGYFSTGNDQERCKPCRVCLAIGKVATTECSATNDGVCRGCKPGYYDDGYGDCYQCFWLSPEDKRNTKGCFATTTQSPRSTTPTSKICEVPQPPDCSSSCDDKKYFHSRQSDTCEECLSCPHGEEPDQHDPCEAQARGEVVRCIPCKSNFFSDRHDQSRCKPCNVCNGIIGRVTTIECSTSTNRVCGGCSPGFYQGPHDECVSCENLSAEIQKTKAACLESTTSALKSTTTSRMKTTTTSQMNAIGNRQIKTTTDSQFNPTTKGSTLYALGNKVTITSLREFHSTGTPKEKTRETVSREVQVHGARKDSSELIFRLALIGGGIIGSAMCLYCMVYCMKNKRKIELSKNSNTRTSTLPSDDSPTESRRKQHPAHLQNQGSSRQTADPDIEANLTSASPPKNSFNKEVDVHQTRTDPQTCPHGGDTTTAGPLTESTTRPGRSISMPQIRITPNQLNELTNRSFLNRELQRISDASSGEESDNGVANFPEEEKELLSHKKTDHSLSMSLKVPSTKKRRRSSLGGLKSTGGVFSSGSTRGNFALDSAPPSTTSINNTQSQSQRSISTLTSHPSRTRRKSQDIKRQSSFDNPMQIRDQIPNNEPNERDSLIQGLDNSQKSPVAQPQQSGEGVLAYLSYQPVHEQYGERTDAHGKQYARQHNLPPSPNPRMHQRPIPHSTAPSDSIHIKSDLPSTLPNQSPAAAVQQIVYHGPVIQAGNIHNLQLDLGNNNNLVQQGGAAAGLRPRDVPPTPESVECTDSAVIFPISEEEAKCLV